MTNISNRPDFQKLSECCYMLSTTIENANIDSSNIFKMNFIDIFFELNKDLYEKNSILSRSDDRLKCCILLRHFLNEIGEKQKYFYFQVIRDEGESINRKKKITFKLSRIIDRPDTILNNEQEPIGIESIDISCILTEGTHVANVDYILTLDEPVPSYIEKFISNFIFKINNRIKEFIENIQYNSNNKCVV